MKNTTTHIISTFITKGFFDDTATKYRLTEKEDSGKSELDWDCSNKINKCISNFDQKHTELQFLINDSKLHLYKRVDHVIFELNQNNKWDVHLVEMKSSIKYQKWMEIKGKFRASYLTVKAIAAILDFEIENYYFYTTYEHASFIEKEDTAPRKAPLGKEAIKPEDEWNGDKFSLNIGDRLPFKHTPIEMIKNSDDILVQKI